MSTAELRGWLDALEEVSAPEPSPIFVAKLETDLRAMDHVAEAEERRVRRPSRSKRGRLLIAAGPIAALTAAAAAAAVTLLPSDPHPRQVTTANPGVTAPAPTPTPSSVPTPTTVTPPPWLPPTAAAPQAFTPTTVAAPHATPTTPAAVPGEHTTPSLAPPAQPVPTTVPPAPTTTLAPGPETLSLHCQGAMVSGSPAVSCAWSQSTSPSFAWYRLYREAAGSNRVLLFSSDARTKTSHGDTTPQAGTTYSYSIDVTNSAGNVIGTSAPSIVNCC